MHEFWICLFNYWICFHLGGWSVALRIGTHQVARWIAFSAQKKENSQRCEQKAPSITSGASAL